MRIIIPLNILHFGTINDGLECYTDGVQDCVCIIIIKPNNDYFFGHILPKKALKYDPQILQLEDVVDRYVEGGDRVYIYGGIEDEEDFLKDHGDISRMFLKKKYNTKPQVEIFRGGFNSSLSISYSSVDGPTVTRVSISGQEEFVSSNVAFYSKAISEGGGRKEYGEVLLKFDNDVRKHYDEIYLSDDESEHEPNNESEYQDATTVLSAINLAKDKKDLGINWFVK